MTNLIIIINFFKQETGVCETNLPPALWRCLSESVYLTPLGHIKYTDTETTNCIYTYTE